MTNRMTFRRALQLSSAAAGLAALASGAAAAQAEPTDTEERDDVIIVTGSRLQADNTLDSAGPVVAFGAEDIRQSGQLDIATLLRESPALQASLPGSFSAFNGTPLGASFLNLRALGEERTLVLENGRRHVSGNEGTAAVDINSISTALLDRVDVLTGGASAIYGADAVSGVVNFIMRDGSDFDGLELRTQAGVTDDGDAEEYFVSLANGFETGDGRGNIVFASEYQFTSALRSGERDFAGSGLQGLLPNGPATGIDERFSNVWLPDVTLPISSDYGIIALGDGGASAFVEAVSSGGVPGCFTIGSADIPTCQVVDGGNLRPYNPGDIFIDGFNASGGDGVPTDPDDEILQPKSERFLFQSMAEYELTDWANFFVDAKYFFSNTQESNQVNGFNDDIPIADDNPFIPAALRAQLGSLRADGIDPVIAVSRDTLDANARSNPNAERQTFRIVGGFTGTIEDYGLNYELSYNFGRTDADITSFARVEDRFFAAIDAVQDPTTGEIVCRSELEGAGYIPPSSPFPAQNADFNLSTFEAGDGTCVPINIFGQNTITAEAADWIFQPTTSQNTIEQRNFLATLSGSSEAWFSLPAGPIDFALGYEWRAEESAFKPDGLTAAGLTFGTIGSNGGPENASSGEYEVSELFIEGRIPLLADVPFIRRLEVQGAYRYSDYDVFDSTDTWNVGGRWSIVDSLTLRATRSRAVRVPNIFEAFSPVFTDFINAASDPCNPQFIGAGTQFRAQNCALLIPDIANYNSTNFVSARIPGQSGGNPDLEPEVADTLTLGAVWRPAGEFQGVFDGLVVTLDYYDIEIEGLIDSLSAFQIAQNCVDLPTINNQFCDAVDRDPTNGFITGFRSGLVNLGSVETSGVDFRVDYGFDLADFGNLPGQVLLSSQGTHFIKNEEVRDPAAPEAVTDVLGELSRPEWIVNFNADYLVGEWSFGWRGRFEGDQLLSGIDNDDVEADPDFANILYTGTAFVHDISASYQLSDRFEVYGGVNNLTEVEPYRGALSRPAGPRGRFFFVGVNAEF